MPDAVPTPAPGDLCVLVNPAARTWTVHVCGGSTPAQTLQSFSSFGEAAAWALDERERRVAAGETNCTIHFPDDCPCCRRTAH